MHLESTLRLFIPTSKHVWGLPQNFLLRGAESFMYSCHSQNHSLQNAVWLNRLQVQMPANINGQRTNTDCVILLWCQRTTCVAQPQSPFIMLVRFYTKMYDVLAKKPNTSGVFYISFVLMINKICSKTNHQTFFYMYLSPDLTLASNVPFLVACKCFN